LIFSGTKGLVAICLLMLVERGRLDLDAPVARYWPEFAARGKEAILVSDVVSHRAALPAVERPLEVADLLDGRALAEALASQAPLAAAGTGPCYHPLTFGWLCGELVRRVDGRTIGRFFAEEVAAPLDLDVWIGLPAVVEDRVARLLAGPGWGSAPHLRPERLAREPELRAVWANPPVLTDAWQAWNRRDFHAAEIPAANGIGAARSLARLYGRLATGGVPLSQATVALGARPRSSGIDPLMGTPVAFGAGFEVQTELAPFGAPADAFGHGGAGGGVHGAWPALGTGFSFVMNELRDEETDTRARDLLAALHEASVG
jgi:CubicO group peptidase (beta-lactamase class C family)